MFGFTPERADEILSKTCAMIRGSRLFRAYMARLQAEASKRRNNEMVGRIVPRRPRKREVLTDRRFGGYGYMTRTLPRWRMDELHLRDERRQIARRAVDQAKLDAQQMQKAS